MTVPADLNPQGAEESHDCPGGSYGEIIGREDRRAQVAKHSRDEENEGDRRPAVTLLKRHADLVQSKYVAEQMQGASVEKERSEQPPPLPGEDEIGLLRAS